MVRVMNDLSPVCCQAIACRIGVNSIPELELQLNCDSRTGIGIETGGIENEIGNIGIGITNRMNGIGILQLLL